MIFHIAEKSVWEACERLDRYVPVNIQNEGFVHCSKLSQVEKTANNYYRGRDDLVLLVIDPEKLEAVLRYENLIGGEEHFHMFMAQFIKLRLLRLSISSGMKIASYWA